MIQSELANSQQSSITLEKITSPLFSNLYESFLSDDDPLSSEQEWRNVFDYPWPTDEGHCGYALLEKGQVVGMLGMVFSKRVIDGETKKFCNLHTWWVREDHRGRSLALLRPILELDDYTITHFTPCDRVRAVSKRLGFKDLRAQLKILLPRKRSSTKHAADESNLLFEESTIAESLSPSDRKILTDHLPYGCGNLLIRDGDRYCYLLYTHVVRHRLPYCHVHYISDKAIFAKHEVRVRNALFTKHHIRFVAIDARIVSDMRFPLSFNFWAPAHGLYKSADIPAEQIDNLYSDVVFLKLTVLPDISHEIGKLTRRIWPFHNRTSDTPHRPMAADTDRHRGTWELQR